jgi:dienelactone hydrolase
MAMARPEERRAKPEDPHSSGVEEEREKLYRLLGPLPELDLSLSARLIREEERAGYLLEVLLLELNGLEPVPAYLVKPKKRNLRSPAVLYNHAHGGDYQLGKEELLAGRSGLASPPYAEELASRGITVLAIDHWNFGERRGRTESELWKEMIWRGRVLWGLMVYDSLRAVDYLSSRQDVDPRRIATLGISMGSTMAWWLGALDPRIKVVVDLCCLTDFQALIESRGLDGHGIYYYVPGLLKHFTAAAINGLIAPRPHLSLAGNLDPLTPPAGLDRIDRELKQLYSAREAPGAWRLVRSDTGHFETALMRAEVLAFLEKWL